MSFPSFEAFSNVKEALKFAREGINRAVEVAPKVKKRKSFDSRSYYPDESKIFYKVSMKRDTTGEVIVKSTGFSEIDEATIEIKLSKIEELEALERTILSAWEMVNRKNFVKSDKKTDKIEIKIQNYDVKINVKFEGSEQSDIKIAKIKIVVENPEEEFEKGTIQAIRRYRVSDGSFI
ncbi:MAG: hypothetical protein ABDI07_02110 [Candidatus Kryptonium sp.]